MALHALVSDVEAARLAAAGGATVVQLRLKGAATEDVVAIGREVARICREHGVAFAVNDDLEAAERLGADYVHLGQDDLRRARAAPARPFGLSATTVAEAVAAEATGAAYIGAGPVWATPSKDDAEPAIGLDGLAEIAAAVEVPVIAIGGVEARNARDCIAAGAAGVAVIRAVADVRALREAVDAALAAG